MFVDGLFIGQHWEHKRTGELVRIDQIHRKDRQVKLCYVNRDDGFVYQTFDVLRMSFTAKEILLK